MLAGGRHPVQLSLDVRIQQIMREELQRGIDDFNGIGGAGIVLDAQTGEILSLVSLPDFDPNLAATAGPDQRFNRATLGVYEMGSTFKTLNTAMALDSGKIKMTDTFDAAHNIQIGRFTIHDFEHMNRALSVPEVFMYSSNIGAARMAMVVGIDIQKAFMAKFGMLRPVSLELPELGKPQYPADWRPINSMTIAFGQGIAVSAVHVVSAVAAMVNGGLIRPATLIKRSPEEVSDGQRVISSNTSDKMRELLRLVRPGRHRQVGRCARLSRRRQDRHGAEAERARLRSECAPCLLRRRLPHERRRAMWSSSWWMSRSRMPIPTALPRAAGSRPRW